MAYALAEQSYAVRKKVGCLIVDYSKSVPRVIADGVNGTLPGFSNCCEIESGFHAGATKLSVVHAEHNAIYKLNDVPCSDNCTLYVTTAPCVDCAKHIIMSGFIKRVVYYNGYKNDYESIELLEKSGIVVDQVNELNLIPDIDKFDYSGTLRKQGYSEEQIRDMVLEKCLSL
jgi:dCMP deaminase